VKSYNQHSRQSGSGDFMANVSRGARVAGCWIKYVLTLLGERVVESTETRREQKEQRERAEQRKQEAAERKAKMKTKRRDDWER